MVEIRTYRLPPTGLMPNSPHVLIHYRQLLGLEQCNPGYAYDLFSSNGWETQWIARYGLTQGSHYHYVHEAMAVLTGAATIRFGCGDIVDNGVEIGKENAGIELAAEAGDVFVLPAGVAHKTHSPVPVEDQTFFDATKATTDTRAALAARELSGFTMMGAYPKGQQWNWAEGGADIGNYSKLWNVPKPNLDPVLGIAGEGLVGLWKEDVLSKLM